LEKKEKSPLGQDWAYIYLYEG